MSTLVPLDTLLKLVVIGTRIASIEAKAAGAKGSAVRLIPSEVRTMIDKFSTPILKIFSHTCDCSLDDLFYRGRIGYRLDQDSTNAKKKGYVSRAMSPHHGVYP